MNKTVQNCLILVAAVLSQKSLAEGAPSITRTPAMPVTTPNRSIYLNGVDISSARNQDLRNVHIKISETGDLFISAPQYQVTEEETFMPLSSYTTKSLPPEHKAPQAMRSPSTSSSMKTNDLGTSEPVTIPKPASDKPTPAANAPAQPASQALPKTGG